MATDGEVPTGMAGGASLPTLMQATKEQASITNYSNSQYSIPLNPSLAFKPRKIKVFTIGAGFSGLLMAHKFQHRFPDMAGIVEHTIFEARKDIGGTWLVNHYPGVQCDVPAHIYVGSAPEVCR